MNVHRLWDKTVDTCNDRNLSRAEWSIIITKKKKFANFVSYFILLIYLLYNKLNIYIYGQSYNAPLQFASPLQHLGHKTYNSYRLGYDTCDMTCTRKRTQYCTGEASQNME